MTDVAIIGMGCRFPGAASLSAFVELLRQGRQVVSGMPAGRLREGDPALDWLAGDFPKGGFVDGIELFDPLFFGMSQDEAEHLDPQQRLLLEVTWQAFENAGIAPSTWRGSNTGVYIGATNADYHRMLFAQPAELSKHSATGTALGTAANRLSYFHDLQGPSLVVDTGCSSSLVALHQAVAALRSGEIDAAIVGGVNGMLHPANTVAHMQAGIISSDDRCRSFDDGANGYVRAEGCGVVLLQRHADALAAQARIWASVVSTAVNHGGASNGFSAPNVQAQKRLLAKAFGAVEAGVERLCYVETHTTGTLMGDAIELKVLDELVRTSSAKQTVQVGSIKTNIGHLESASGIASLIKAACMAHFREYYPTLHFSRPNRFYKYAEGTLRVSQEHRSDASLAQGLIGVSGFSFGGTNGFALLKAHSNLMTSQASSCVDRLLVVSAKSKTSLLAMLASLRKALPGYREADRGTLARQLLRRDAFAWRVAITGEHIGEWIEGIEAVLAEPDRHVRHCPQRRPTTIGVSFSLEEGEHHSDDGASFDIPLPFSELLGTSCMGDLASAPLRGFLSTLRAVEQIIATQLFDDVIRYRGLGALLPAYLESRLEAGQAVKVLSNTQALEAFLARQPKSPQDSLAVLEIVTAGARQAGGRFVLQDGTRFDDLAHALAELWCLGHTFDGHLLSAHDTLLFPLLPTYHFDSVRCWLHAG
ncbi:polyketide synthase [Pseudomonas entomophila]|uniref:Beta-ketoacyl synthase N-terminal-like domain-containing protein n=2 Tax=Pseudomonas entomophila TaxID=312306 RepID=A0ABY9QQ58_9PSED|nr:polyketide synthase [Pseudomonas entomophila]WMW06177.1 beta-ketoacyl synthase N-terminal-like domain-containing protein [Pseudomonas entomophila]